MGVAVSEGFLAEPLEVVHYTKLKDLVRKIGEIAGREGVEKVVVGVSEGEMAAESKNFSSVLAEKLNIPVTTFDETLTSKDAQKISLEVGVRRSKRREMEDAYAASIMLQNFLDSQG